MTGTMWNGRPLAPGGAGAEVALALDGFPCSVPCEALRGQNLARIIQLDPSQPQPQPHGARAPGPGPVRTSRSVLTTERAATSVTRDESNDKQTNDGELMYDSPARNGLEQVAARSFAVLDSLSSNGLARRSETEKARERVGACMEAQQHFVLSPFCFATSSMGDRLLHHPPLFTQCLAPELISSPPSPASTVLLLPPMLVDFESEETAECGMRFCSMEADLSNRMTPLP
ncbi:hypothetical protein AXG93_4697s1060 [Marchantia polymorpha subsp. ruderalis]|uniref:Uncharacterized protein n=1 Tax=Marchantia polymorpha subsp. ruderalis TaxID=1480154 RepID=A0A176VNJ2_MARPO|nr:hypothetical protein AXG93_4697s1060 [Marchantia polymorpha subsp. ruderalis]